MKNSIKIQMSSLFGEFNKSSSIDGGECLQEKFSKKLVETGKVKTIEEANKTPRYLYCPCKKCNRIKM